MKNYLSNVQFHLFLTFVNMIKKIENNGHDTDNPIYIGKHLSMLCDLSTLIPSRHISRGLIGKNIKALEKSIF